MNPWYRCDCGKLHVVTFMPTFCPCGKLIKY